MEKKSEFGDDTEYSNENFHHKKEKVFGAANVIDNCFVANFKKLQWWYQNMANLLSLDRSSLENHEPERMENNWLKTGTTTLASLIIVGVSLYVIYTNIINIGNLK